MTHPFVSSRTHLTAATAAESGRSFHAVERRRTFEQILLQIEEAIIDGRLQPGDRLPTERDLALTFGVSRATVREALRVLEMFGVIVARRGTGPEAGSIVADNAENGLESALRLHVGLRRIPATDVVEVRAVLEQQAAQLAAGRSAGKGTGGKGTGSKGTGGNVTGGKVTGHLHEIVGGMRAAATISEFIDLDTEFHVELAQVSGNALLPVLMEALRGTMRWANLEGLRRRPDWRAERGYLVGEHEQMITYIEAGDGVAAGAALRDHVTRVYWQVMEPEAASVAP